MPSTAKHEQSPPPERRAWSPREVAKLLGISQASVYRAIQAGDLYARRWGTRYMIPTEALTAFLENKPYSP